MTKYRLVILLTKETKGFSDNKPFRISETTFTDVEKTSDVVTKKMIAGWVEKLKIHYFGYPNVVEINVIGWSEYKDV